MDEQTTKKNKWARLIIIFTFIVLMVRLWDLQVMRGGEMRRLSEQNRVRVKKILAPRGIVFDRNGKILADSRPSFNLYITPEDMKDFNQTVDGLASLLKLDREDIIQKLKESSNLPPSFPVKIGSDISMDDVAKVEANRIYLPGVSMQIEPRRTYPYDTMLAHVLGYVSEINQEELKKESYHGYSRGDYVGKYGLEKMYESFLRGTDGERSVEVDAMGREIRTLGRKDPIPGNNLYLNIDMDAQIIAEKALEGKKGGAIAVEPKSGEVLVLASHPAFDPNLFSTGISKENWRSLITDKHHPLQNRVIQGRFPPGSTFKIVLAMKALEDNIINEGVSFSCRGGFPFGRRVFRCWKKEGHGIVNLYRAIVESCDVYFYNLGLKIGVDRIHDMSVAIGLGEVTGIDLPGEKKGLIPSTEWKKKTYKQPWYEGETLSVAIGQGAVWLTPIQLVQLSSFVANQGVTFKPQLVNRVVSPDGKILKKFEPVLLKNVKLKKKTIMLVREGMKGVVNEERGTAYGSRIEGISMSGKTGTAQSSTLDQARNLGDHAWFIAYAPSDDPDIAMTIIVEHGGHGSSAAAPIAKAVAESVVREKVPVREARINENR